MSHTQVMEFTSTLHHDTYPAVSKASQKGHKVLITGASKGIGRVIAASYAKAGADTIIIAARSDLADIEAEILAAAKQAGTSPQVVRLILDVTSPDSVAEAAAKVKQTVGKLDILINNAGYLEKWTPIIESDVEEWWKTWEINIRGVHLVTRAFLPLVLQSEMKTIINIGSLGGHFRFPGASSYQSTKFALMRFTEFICAEYEDQGIVAITIHPGGVPTGLAMGMPEAVRTILIDKPELAADTLAWLTQERQEWLNGRYVSVTWDMPELFSRKDEIVEGGKLKMRLVV